jgi:hypothetical protein
MAIDTTPPQGPFQLTSVTARPIVADEEDQWNELMRDVHPLGNAHFPGHSIKYVAEMRGHAVALLCFSACAYHLADRDRYIGWNVEQAMQRRHFVVQNSRFLILSGKKRRNLASRVLSVCARRVSLDWPRRFGFEPLMLESFVDPVHFSGTCYKAAGWDQVGSTRGFRRDGREFYSPDSHPKQIWMKSLRTEARQWLRAETMPEPWNGFEKPLPAKRVADRLGVNRLLSLFEALQSIPDWRRTNGRQYPLACCLSIIVCGYLAGCETLEQYAEFAATLTQPQLRALRSWSNPKTNRYEAPRKTTLWRIAAEANVELFEQVVNAWLSDTDMSLQAIAIDGKALRATPNNKDGGSFAVNVLNHRGSAPLFCSSSPTVKVRNWPLLTSCSIVWKTSTERS